MVVVQRVAARLGWWPAGADEVSDQHLAGKLYARTDDVPTSAMVDLLQAARRHHLRRESPAALRLWLSADRLHRLPVPLLHVATLLCREGRIRESAWALRTALLEPADQFPSVAVYTKARLLAAQLSLTSATQPAARRDSLTTAQRVSADLDATTLTFSIRPSWLTEPVIPTYAPWAPSVPSDVPPTGPNPAADEARSERAPFFEAATAPVSTDGFGGALPTTEVVVALAVEQADPGLESEVVHTGEGDPGALDATDPDLVAVPHPVDASLPDDPAPDDAPLPDASPARGSNSLQQAWADLIPEGFRPPG